MDKSFDHVIKSVFVSAKTTITFAKEVLAPLINRFEQQRPVQSSKLYKKLKIDIIKGCIMPPLTIAFRDEDIDLSSKSQEEISQYINKNINKAFILDGIQRLNTILSIDEDDLPQSTTIYLNILISNSMDKLLYRMITLNNGQKPMSARHQIEMIANSIYDFGSLSIDIQTEKEQKLAKNKKEEYAFSRENMIKAYMAFISQSINIDNQKIIESKMDELLTNKIMDSNITDRQLQFSEVVDFIAEMCKKDNALYKWFSITNNMIGFASAFEFSYAYINQISAEKLVDALDKLESAFSSINRSKIRVGTFRRKMVNYFIKNFERCESQDLDDLIESLSLME